MAHPHTSPGPVSHLPSRGPGVLAQAATPRLTRHPVFSSRSEQDVRCFLAARNFHIDFPADDRDALDVHLNGVYLPGMYLGHLCYGRALAIKASRERSDFWLQFSSHRRFEIEVGGYRGLCDTRHGAVLSPTCENLIRSEAGCGRIALSLSRDALVRQLSALLERPVTQPLVFAPSLDLSRGYGRSLALHVHAAVDDFEQDHSLLRNSLAMQSFEQFVLTALLLSHPHNYTAELQSPAKRPDSRHVRHAIDFIENNLTAPITLADIAQEAGVSGRVLFRHFRHCTGTSPMAYLRNARFRRVREALRRATPDERVVDIAALWGFDHIGRFSIEYRRRFGEKPSATKSSGPKSRRRRTG